ncbi:MAG: DUF3791 domain-containing protein [Bacteroidaceae bacterium]|nr:DUF3791 domain-containing protein [Bacteroidaceae bacterium]
MYSTRDIAEYVVMLISAFARHYSMSDVEAYKYLRQYGAITLMHDYYDVMHTQSFDDMVQSLTTFCRRKGGTL